MKRVNQKALKRIPTRGTPTVLICAWNKAKGMVYKNEKTCDIVSRKKRRPYRLTEQRDLIEPTQEEIDKILFAADDCVLSAGRTTLAKMLKGSKEKAILEHKLNTNRSYGAFKEKKREELIKMIDWMIYHDYLDIEYDGRLPMIKFGYFGWEYFKRIFADDLYKRIEIVKKRNEEALAFHLKEINREVILILLDKITEKKDPELMPFLELWRSVECKKLRKYLGRILLDLSQKRADENFE